MEITSVAPFLAYYERIRSRTNKLVALIPPDCVEWTYRQGKYTFGDIIRHIACIERYMYAETVAGRKSCYQGCNFPMACGYEQVVRLFNRLHDESLAIFRSLSDEDLSRKCKTPAGSPIAIGKWLRAMVEHEVHHRGQLYIYLGLLGISTPPIFGMTAEEVAATSV